VPASPGSLTANAISASQIDLAWTDNSANEAEFGIERAPDNGGAPGTYVRIASVSANVTSYSDGGLLAGTRYWYRVAARTANGASGYSNAVRAATKDAPPFGLSVQGRTTGANGKGSLRADLTWTRGTAAAVDIWRNGSRIVAGATNSGSYSDGLGNKRGTYTYQVCLPGLTGSANCTSAAAVTF
jgi:hypothetical protein